MNLSNGKIWPVMIGLSIAGVFTAAIMTIVVTGQADIQKSDAYMTYYQDADAKANDYIEDRIAFNKAYDIAYLTKKITQEDSTVTFSVKDKSGKSIDNAKIMISVNRPETEEFNKIYTDAIYKDGLYSFKNVSFPKAGIWNIVTKFEVNDKSRFLNIKVDTRNDKIKYFD
jgi:hypothetical protein